MYKSFKHTPVSACYGSWTEADSRGRGPTRSEWVSVDSSALQYTETPRDLHMWAHHAEIIFKLNRTSKLVAPGKTILLYIITCLAFVRQPGLAGPGSTPHTRHTRQTPLQPANIRQHGWRLTSAQCSRLSENIFHSLWPSFLNQAELTMMPSFAPLETRWRAFMVSSISHCQPAETHNHNITHSSEAER